jgi:hypothetical protein
VVLCVVLYADYLRKLSLPKARCVSASFPAGFASFLFRNMPVTPFMYIVYMKTTLQ